MFCNSQVKFSLRLPGDAGYLNKDDLEGKRDYVLV